MQKAHKNNQQTRRYLVSKFFFWFLVGCLHLVDFIVSINFSYYFLSVITLIVLLIV